MSEHAFLAAGKPELARPPPVRPAATVQAEREAGAAGAQDGVVSLSPLQATAADIAHARARIPGSPGAALEPSAQQAMASRLSFDFSRVRVHTDAEAATLAAGEHARAYTVGHHVVFGAGQYLPHSMTGQALLAHELGHVVQQAIAGVLAVQRDDLSGPGATTTTGPQPPGSPVPPKATPGDIAAQVISWVSQKVPDASGGVGNFPAAFGLLIPLDAATLIAVFEQLNKQFFLDLLWAEIAAAGAAQGRMHALILAVLYRVRDLPDTERAAAHGLVDALDPGDRAELVRYLSPLSEHKREIFLNGPEAEAKRLEDAQVSYWEDKRRSAEAAAKAQAEKEAKEAKGKGKAPPAAPAPVTMGDVVSEDVQAGTLQAAPTDSWTSLPQAARDKWANERAPAAFAKVLASIKGTQLESVMKGHPLVFDQFNILKNGAYAYQDGPNLVCGITFVEDAEKDPKNVWPLLAHEIGGHLAYGTTYASSFIEKARDRLPESDRKKWTDTEEGRRNFFDAYEYNETEIFAALRQRRYDLPESGPVPVHGAIKPDENIEGRLSQLDRAFPKSVATAILEELNRKVQAGTQILARDKKFFLDQVKKHGYSL